MSMRVDNETLLLNYDGGEGFDEGDPTEQGTQGTTGQQVSQSIPEPGTTGQQVSQQIPEQETEELVVTQVLLNEKIIQLQKKKNALYENTIKLYELQKPSTISSETEIQNIKA